MEGLKLKNPHGVRLFISSPFNGMEMERDILTKFYWPKIESALRAKGLHLKLVDMRWGITHSSSSASQTVNICLKEIDRSDVFIGLYGQRYGWNGRNDPELQENFDKAAEKYPWVDHYRDRSVTELEFLHGHLNNPGNIPACFCFREKAYDDKMRKEAEISGDAKRQRNFTAENENSFNKLEDLKTRVLTTKAETLGVAMNYTTPQEGADFIYDQVWKYVENEILAKIEKPMSEKEKVTLAHKAYQKSQCGLYVGGKRYLDELDNYVNSTDGDYHPLTIIGPTGCGKTALLSNWLEDKMSSLNLKDSKDILYYHFVGAEADSILPRYLMNRLIDFVQNALTGEGFEYDGKNRPKLAKLFEKLSDTLGKMKLDEHKEKRLIIVLDNIDKISLSKTSMPLFWLPKDLPNNVKIILSLTEGGTRVGELLEILTDGHKTKKITIDHLTEEDKKEMCNRLLEDNSKSMDHEQLFMITSSPKTNNPFFLKILINELCVAGRFRQLNQQINNLLDSDDVLGLLVKVIERIQEDYANSEYVGNVVDEVMCAVCLCQKGISESEFPMPQHVWAPVIYAIGAFLTDRGNILGFAFPDFNKAVKLVFMPTEEIQNVKAKKVSAIFYDLYKKCVKDGRKIDVRIATELLHLLKLSNNRAQMMQVLSDIRIFETVCNSNQFQLNDYWQWMGTPAQAIANRYMRSLDIYMAEKYAEHLDYYETDRLQKIIKWKSTLIQTIRTWFTDSKLFHGLVYLFDRELEIDTHRPDLNPIKRKEYNCVVKYQKACFLSDTEKYHEALELHKEVLEMRKELIKAKAMDEEDIGMSYHGIGLCHYNVKDYDEAEKWYNMSLEAQNKAGLETQRASTYCNLGLIAMTQGQLDKALDLFQKSNTMREEAEPNVLSLEIAYNYHNIGLAYRKKKDLDTAEKYYLKSLKIKENLLGRDAFDVALSIMNIGTLEVHRKNHEKALEWARESLRIFTVLAPEGSYRTMMAQENVVNQLTMLDRYEEAEPMFREVRAYLKTMPGGAANGLPPLHRRFIKWYMARDNYVEASDTAYELVKCSKGKGQDFAYLALSDNSFPAGKKPVRPEEATLDYGLKKFPMNRDILIAKLSILYEDSPDELMPYVMKFCEDTPNDASKDERYTMIAVVLHEDIEDIDKAISFLEEAIKNRPNSSKLLEKLESLKALKETKPKE